MTDDSKRPIRKKRSPFIKLLTKFETTDEEIRKLHSFQLRLASPQKIKQWSDRRLPGGEIIGCLTNAQTVNYKTLKPEKGGLFCERIFGPVKDYYCSCGKQETKKTPKLCPNCGVQFISSRSRRYKMGYIKLVSPVTHIWYLKNSPSSLSLILNLKKKRLEAITYCSETFSSNIKSFRNELNVENIWPLLKNNPVFDEVAFRTCEKSFEQGLEGQKNPYFFNDQWLNFILGVPDLIKNPREKEISLQHRKVRITNYLGRLKLRDFPFFFSVMEKKAGRSSPLVISNWENPEFFNETFFFKKHLQNNLQLLKFIRPFTHSKSKKFAFLSSPFLIDFYKTDFRISQKKLFANAKSFSQSKKVPKQLSMVELLQVRTTLKKYSNLVIQSDFLEPVLKNSFLIPIRSNKLLGQNNQVNFNLFSLKNRKSITNNNKNAFHFPVSDEVAFFEKKSSGFFLKFSTNKKILFSLLNFQKLLKKKLTDNFLQKEPLGVSSLNDQFQPLSFLKEDSKLSYAKTNCFGDERRTFLLCKKADKKRRFLFARTCEKSFEGLIEARGFHEPFKLSHSTQQSKFLIWFDFSYSTKGALREREKFSPIQFSLPKQKELKSLIQTFRGKKKTFQANSFSLTSKNFYLDSENGQFPLREQKICELIPLNFFKRDYFHPEIRKRDPIVKIQIREPSNHLAFFANAKSSPLFSFPASKSEFYSELSLQTESKKNKANYFFEERPLDDLIKVQKTCLKNPLGNFNFRRYFSVKLSLPLKRALLSAQIKEYKKFSFTSKKKKTFLKFFSKVFQTPGEKLKKASLLEVLAFLTTCEKSFSTTTLGEETKTYILNDVNQKQRLKLMTQTVFGTFACRSFKKIRFYSLKESFSKNSMQLPAFLGSGSQVLNVNCFSSFQTFLQGSATFFPLEKRPFKKKQEMFLFSTLFQNLKQKNSFHSHKKLIRKGFFLPSWLQGEDFNRKEINLTTYKWNSKKKRLQKSQFFQKPASVDNLQLTDQSFACKTFSYSRKNLSREALSFFPKCYLITPVLKGSVSKNWDQKTLTFFIDKLEKKLTLRKPILLNNYYTIPQSFQWKFQKDWRGFLKYMTGLANKKDSLIPSYLERGLTFDLLLTGAGAIKNFLSLFTTNKTASIGSIELLAANVNGTIRQLNQDIAKYDEFFKYQSIVMCDTFLL